MDIITDLKKFGLRILSAPFVGREMPTPKVYLLLALSMSAGLVGIALMMQYLGGFAPCVFCIYERWPYAVIALVSILGFIMPCQRFKFVALIVINISLVINVGLSAYHVAIEHKWVPPPSVCQSTIDIKGLSFDQFKKKLLETKPVPCDQVPLRILGLSLVEYNLLICLLALGFFVSVLRAYRHHSWQACEIKAKKI